MKALPAKHRPDVVVVLPAVVSPRTLAQVAVGMSQELLEQLREPHLRGVRVGTRCLLGLDPRQPALSILGGVEGFAMLPAVRSPPPSPPPATGELLDVACTASSVHFCSLLDLSARSLSKYSRHFEPAYPPKKSPQRPVRARPRLGHPAFKFVA